MLRNLAAENFPPFGSFELELRPVENKPEDLAEVHLFTGVNGTGKTRILATLAALLGNPEPLKKRLKGSESPVSVFVSNTLPAPTPFTDWPDRLDAKPNEVRKVADSGLLRALEKTPAFAYSGLAYITDAPITVMAEVPRPDRNSCLAFVRPENQSNGLIQAIANLRVQAAMDLMNEPGDKAGPTRATRIVRALETAIAEVTRQKFSFQVTSYPKASLEVNWGTERLPFDLLPDGLRSIIGWMAHAVVMMDVWLQGKSNLAETEAIFLLDEIESHLHPAWQRRILPAFQRLFPKAQIFVATHSPFVIASLNHGWIHPLSIGENGKVKFEEVIPASEGDSYVSVVEDIMGLKEWYDPETEQLLSDFRVKRDAAYRGDLAARGSARELAATIGSRSMELEYMMGRELSQMDRQLAKAAAAK